MNWKNFFGAKLNFPHAFTGDHIITDWLMLLSVDVGDYIITDWLMVVLLSVDVGVLTWWAVCWQLEELPAARETIKRLQQKVENLEAIVNIRADYEKLVF